MELTLVLHSHCMSTGVPLVFRSSWKDTLAALMCAARGRPPPPAHVPIVVRGFYSDDVFQAWLCSAVAPPDGWFSVDNVDRRAGLTPQCVPPFSTSLLSHHLRICQIRCVSFKKHQPTSHTHTHTHTHDGVSVLRFISFSLADRIQGVPQRVRASKPPGGAH